MRFAFLLSDVTSTYFEGQAQRNPQAQRGYSRDQRSDCQQVGIGLVRTPEGLPLSFEMFANNRPDVTTVADVVGAIEEKYGAAERIWVMDRGMVSAPNFAFLRAARHVIWSAREELAAGARSDVVGKNRVGPSAARRGPIRNVRFSSARASG